MASFRIDPWPVMLAVGILAVWGFSSYESRNVATQVDQRLKEQQIALESVEDRLKIGDLSVVGEVDKLRQNMQTLEGAYSDTKQHIRVILDKEDEAQSRKAVIRAELAVLKGQVAVVRQQLQKMRRSLADWDARHGTLMSGDLGRRIVGSAKHLEIVRGILLQDRPSSEKLTEYQVAIDELAPLLEGSSLDPGAEIIITNDHQQKITDAATWLKDGLAQMEQQNMTIDAVLRATASLPPAKITLKQLLDSENEDIRLKHAVELNAALAAAGEKAREDQIRRVEQLHREVIEKETTLKEEVEKHKKEKLAEEARMAEEAHQQSLRIAQQAAADQMRLAEEAAKARKAKVDVDIAGIQKAVDKAVLEAEYERDLSEIKRHLQAFITPGHTYRKDGTRGPMSLAFLISDGALRQDRKGMERVYWLAHRENDRPPGAIPYFLGGDVNWKDVDKGPVEIAQRFLNKYGELLVEKQLLDP